ncbi:MAG: OsmC family protein [Acidimicrobiales bacterium]|jgi:uncharacterized OsmC-like protein
MNGGIEVTHDGGDRFGIAIRRHVLSVDQPVGDGGDDTAPTPTELFIASLASCVAFYVRRFLVRHGLPTDELSVTAEFNMAGRPSRVGEIDLRVHVADEVPSERRDALLAVASHCTVQNTLEQPPQVNIHVATSPSLA